MKKSVLQLALLLTASTFLISCASQQEVENLRYQLRVVNKKIADMKVDTVDPLQKRQAAASGQMDTLEQDIMQLKSQLEESYHLNQRLREQNKELEESISSIAENEASRREEALRRMEEQQKEKEAKLTQLLNQKIREQEASVKAIQQARIKEAERRAQEAAIAAELAKKRSKSASNTMAAGQRNVEHIKTSKTKKKNSVVAPPTVPQTAQTQAQPPKSAVQPVQPTAAPPTPAVAKVSQPAATGTTFSAAKNLYDQKKYSQAYSMFNEIAAISGAAESVDARYMMGESLFAQKEYDRAIMQYQKIIAQHSSHGKAPAAMLKQAMAFEKLADKDTAKVIYKKVLKKHGGSSEAKIAQERLNQL